MASDSQIDEIRREHNYYLRFYREMSRSLNISRLGRITQLRDCDRFQGSNKDRDDLTNSKIEVLDIPW
jgi:hypothetical protein